MISWYSKLFSHVSSVIFCHNYFFLQNHITMLVLNLSSSKSSWDDLWEVWSIDYHSKVYWVIFHKPPFNRCSIRMNMGQPDAMFISFLPGRWKELEWRSGWKLSLWCFFPAWLMSVSVTFWWKGQGRSASYGPCMIMKKKVEMSPFPQSISIQVGPGVHFVAYL